jgi:tryptophanyl-tRNA synthetase
MSLRDGTKKMSKSDPSDQSRINLTDPADVIAQKIKRAKTDPHPLPDHEKELGSRPEADNLLTIYAALDDISRGQAVSRFAGQPFSKFKDALTELAVDRLAPIATEMRRLTADPGAVDAVLRDGAERARSLAAPVLREVYEVVGFLQP